MDEQVRKEQWVLGDHLDQLGADIKGGIRTRADYWILSGAERLGILSARVVMMMAGGLLAGLVLLFSSMALAYWLGHELNSLALGCLIVASIYVVLTLVVWLVWKNWLREYIIVNVINEIYIDDEE